MIKHHPIMSVDKTVYILNKTLVSTVIQIHCVRKYRCLQSSKLLSEPNRIESIDTEI